LAVGVQEPTLNWAAAGAAHKATMKAQRAVTRCRA